MSGAENVPWSNERGIHSRVSDQALTLAPDLLKRFHYRRWLRHAQVNEMTNAGAGSGGDCGLNRSQIDCSKLSRFGRTWVPNSDQVDEGVCWRNRMGIIVCLKRIAYDALRARRELRLRSNANNRPDRMPSPNELGN